MALRDLLNEKLRGALSGGRRKAGNVRLETVKQGMTGPVAEMRASVVEAESQGAAIGLLN